MISRSFLLLLVSCLLWACASSPTEPEPDPLSQSSAVSVTLPGFVTGPDTTLHWYSSLKWMDDAEGRYRDNARVMQDALQREFERKGYSFVDTEANYDVVAVVILGDLQDSPELAEFFRLYPTLAEPAKNYGQGTVLVAIAPAGTRDIVWRGALEVFTPAPGQLTAEAREQRMRWAAGQLLESIPYLP